MRSKDCKYILAINSRLIREKFLDTAEFLISTFQVFHMLQENPEKLYYTFCNEMK